MRASLMREVRTFFAQKNVLEVDCPALTNFSPVDLNIDVMESENRFLFTSPEYGMKRLLSQGSGDIYQMGHVFRKEEPSSKHNPEFTLIEWYRLESDLETFLEECVELISLFVGNVVTEKISYREAFIKYAQIDPFLASHDELKQRAIELLSPNECEAWSFDDFCDLILSLHIEPQFDQKKITILTHYPASQAALAKTAVVDGAHVAERFEFFYRGLELGNGYHELTDAKEQKNRFTQTNQKRVENGKKPLPIDTHFLKALEKGLPDCYGVAMGFDRLLMAKLGTEEIAKVLPFTIDNA